MPLPVFNTSKYDDYENPAPVIKVGALSAQDATDPYAVYQRQALEANDAKWKAKTEALRAARMDTPDKMERIAQALLAFGAPTRGNNFAALSNATKSLSMSGKEVEDAQRERDNQLAQLRAQQEEAASAIKEKYGFAGAQAQQAMALKRVEGNEIVMGGPRNDIPYYKTGLRAGQTATGYTAPPAGAYDNKPTTMTSAGGRSVEGWTDQKGEFHQYAKEAKEPMSPETYADRIAQAADAKAMATATATAKIALPEAANAANTALKDIDALKTHPGLHASVGMAFDPAHGGLGPIKVPGSDAANFKAKYDKIRGGSFLAARQMLKGGGAITDFEGTKAESAMAAMDKAQSEEEFLAALSDYQGAIKRGLAIMANAARGNFTPLGQAPAAAAPAGGGENTKVVGGVAYIKRGKDWYPQ